MRPTRRRSWRSGRPALYSANDPLVSGLLTRMESEESQGLPTNVAWAGPAGIWPGESMNMSETYLLRDDVKKNAAMLMAALNHSYTTNVFKEEILTDVTKERACDTPHSNRQNMQGTGDMPEAWGNANAVDLLRDMLVQERTDAPATVDSKTTLHLLAGLPAEWIAQGRRSGECRANSDYAGDGGFGEADANVGYDAACRVRSGSAALSIRLCMFRCPRGSRYFGCQDGRKTPLPSGRYRAVRQPRTGDCCGGCARRIRRRLSSRWLRARLRGLRDESQAILLRGWLRREWRLLRCPALGKARRGQR